MIGNSISSFNTQLPTQIDILRLYYNLSPKLPDSKKISTVVKQIEDRYRQNDIRIRGTETIRLKLKRLVSSCKKFVLMRMNCRHSNAEKMRQEKFHRDIHNLFEVGVSTAQMDTVQEVSSNDRNQSQQQAPQQVDVLLYAYDDNTQDDPDDPDESDSSDSDPDYSPSKDNSRQTPKRKISISSPVLRQVSQTKGSYRMCQNLLKLGCQIPGADPNDYQLSKSTLWKRITKTRLNRKNEMLAALRASDCKVIIQFDGKTCPRLNERHVGTDERLIVICHTMKGDVPLGLFIVKSHSSANCSQALLDAINNNNLRNRVVGLVSDTEKVNTGRFSGVCLEIERKLERPMLNLMCRHHVFEIILKSVFQTLFGRTTSPRISTFDVLKEKWNDIKQNNFAYAPIEFEELLQPIVNEFYTEASDTIRKHANNPVIRSDYAELNDLVLKFTGIATGNPFKVLGATNNARWMSRAIYSLKALLLRDHLDMDPSFIRLLERFNMFVALIYTKFWNRCSNSADAPFNDLQLLKELDLYKEIDAEISQAALDALKRHLWYLSDELILLALFSEKVSNDEKNLMALPIIPAVQQRTENSIKHNDEIENIQNTELHHFVSRRSFFLLDTLGINTDFLLHEADTWNEYQSYKQAKLIVQDLVTVVNDSSERALQVGANLIVNQKVRTEERLQNFIASTFSQSQTF